MQRLSTTRTQIQTVDCRMQTRTTREESVVLRGEKERSRLPAFDTVMPAKADADSPMQKNSGDGVVVEDGEGGTSNDHAVDKIISSPLHRKVDDKPVS